jgi:hypothetical protein
VGETPSSGCAPELATKKVPSYARFRVYVYFVLAYSPQISFVKIGKSKNPRGRVPEMQTYCPFRLTLVSMIHCKSDRHALGLEYSLHRALKKQHYRGEWFLWNEKTKTYLQKKQKFQANSIEIPLRAFLPEGSGGFLKERPTP